MKQHSACGLWRHSSVLGCPLPNVSGESSRHLLKKRKQNAAAAGEVEGTPAPILCAHLRRAAGRAECDAAAAAAEAEAEVRGAA